MEINAPIVLIASTALLILVGCQSISPNHDLNLTLLSPFAPSTASVVYSYEGSNYPKSATVRFRQPTPKIEFENQLIEEIQINGCGVSNYKIGSESLFDIRGRFSQLMMASSAQISQPCDINGLTITILTKTENADGSSRLDYYKMQRSFGELGRFEVKSKTGLNFVQKRGVH